MGKEMMVFGFSGAIGSGKTTAARYFVEQFDFVRVPFAGPLKDMAKAIGLTDAEVNGSLKESPCALLCGLTPRQFMQLLGTEFGRELIHPDLWVNAWRKAVQTAYGSVVADDVRFPNEVAAIRALGGKVVHISRPGNDASKTGAHASERSNPDADFQVINDGTVADFVAALDRTYRRLRAVAA